jgi:hypothetical protein
MQDEAKTRGKRTVMLIAILAVMLVGAMSVLLYCSVAAPKSTETLVDVMEDESQSAIEGDVSPNPQNSDASQSEGEATPSLLDLPGVTPASGEFDMGNILDNVDFDLTKDTGEFDSIIAAIQSVDPSFDPKGYMVSAHADHRDDNGIADNVKVTVTLYIGDIKTNSTGYVHVEDGSIQYVNIMGIYYPDAAELEHAEELRASFEASPASKEAIERTRSQMWPDATGTTQVSYSEYYLYNFRTGKLLLYINDNRSVDNLDGVVVAKSEKIDVQEVLAND